MSYFCFWGTQFKTQIQLYTEYWCCHQQVLLIWMAQIYINWGQASGPRWMRWTRRSLLAHCLNGQQLLWKHAWSYRYTIFYCTSNIKVDCGTHNYMQTICTLDPNTFKLSYCAQYYHLSSCQCKDKIENGVGKRAERSKFAETFFIKKNGVLVINESDATVQKHKACEY